MLGSPTEEDRLHELLRQDLQSVLQAERSQVTGLFESFSKRQLLQLQMQQRSVERALSGHHENVKRTIDDAFRRVRAHEQNSKDEAKDHSQPLEAAIGAETHECQNGVAESRGETPASSKSSPTLGATPGSPVCDTLQESLRPEKLRRGLTIAQRWNDIEDAVLRSKGPLRSMTFDAEDPPLMSTRSERSSASPSVAEVDDETDEEFREARRSLIAADLQRGGRASGRTHEMYWQERVALSQSFLGSLLRCCTLYYFHMQKFLGERRFECRHVTAIVDNRLFGVCIFSLIALNALLIGIATDYTIKVEFEAFDVKANSVDQPTWMIICDLVFIFAFMGELVLRMLALQGQFFLGPAWQWNIFDATLTISSFLELALIAVNINLSYIRVFRLARIARSLRVFHLLQWASLIRSLRLMLLAIIKSAVPFVWAVLVMVMIIFVFAVILLNGVTNYVADAADDNPHIDEMRLYFGSMSMTLLTLFSSVSGGKDWWEIMELFLELSTWYGMVYLFFILVSVLAVLNIITGIFVKEALEMASQDRDLQMQLELEENRFLLKKLKDLFEQIDDDQGGTISLEEFQRHMEVDEIRVLFSLLGLEVSDAISFFKILDVDGSQELEIEEFVMGCMRHKGSSTMDLECAMVDLKRMIKKLPTVEMLQGRLETIEVDIIEIKSLVANDDQSLL